MLSLFSEVWKRLSQHDPKEPMPTIETAINQRLLTSVTISEVLLITALVTVILILIVTICLRRKLFSESAKALLSKTLDKVDDVELGTNGQIESLIEQTVSGNASKSDTNQICESGEVKSRDQEQEVSYSHSGQIISQPTYDKYLSTDEHQREANFRDLIGDNEDTKMTVIDQFSAGEETIPKSFSHEALVAEHVERRHGCSRFNEYFLTGDDNIQLSHEALVAEHVERGHGCSWFNEYVLTGDDNIQLIGWEASPESYLAENQLVDGAQSRNCCRPGENTQGREPHSVSEFLFSPTNSERSELSLHSRSTGISRYFIYYSVCWLFSACSPS